jgi:hypothetical protein
VTRPTTIRAITEIPAKTPRPIGRTESFFPGTAKADEEVCWAEADAPVPEGEEDAEALLLPWSGEAAGAGVEDGAGVLDAGDEDDEIGCTGATEDTPFTNQIVSEPCQLTGI